MSENPKSLRRIPFEACLAVDLQAPDGEPTVSVALSRFSQKGPETPRVRSFKVGHLELISEETSGTGSDPDTNQPVAVRRQRIDLFRR